MRTHAAKLRRVTDENGRPGEADVLPVVEKTANQIVAWNIACYRKAAGLKQEELGELIGRSKRNISADERSWDGGHTREFNAQEIIALSAALEVPIGAFYLPPEDDGVTARYLIRLSDDDSRPLDMSGLMTMVVPDSEGDGRAMDAYRRRIDDAFRRYLGPEWTDEPARWRTLISERGLRAERAQDARRDAEALMRLAGKMLQVAKVYEQEDDE